MYSLRILLNYENLGIGSQSKRKIEFCFIEKRFFQIFQIIHFSQLQIIFPFFLFSIIWRAVKIKFVSINIDFAVGIHKSTWNVSEKKFSKDYCKIIVKISFIYAASQRSICHL